MNIYATKGDKIMVTPETMKHGHPHDRENALQYLKPGRIYTIERTEVYSYHTSVFLSEIPGVEFNSVNFTDVPKKRGRPRRNSMDNTVLFPANFREYLVEQRGLKPGVANAYEYYINRVDELLDNPMPHPAQWERLVDEKNVQQIEHEFDTIGELIDYSIQAHKTGRVKKLFQNAKSALAQYRLFLFSLIAPELLLKKESYLPKQLTIENLWFGGNFTNKLENP